MRAALFAIAVAVVTACGSTALKGAGEDCVGSTECAAGLLCNFSANPPVCAGSGDVNPGDASVTVDGSPSDGSEPVDAAHHPDARAIDAAHVDAAKPIDAPADAAIDAPAAADAPAD